MPEILESITGEQDEPRVPTDFTEKKRNNLAKTSRIPNRLK
jgi:hypothetical protein